MLPEFDVFDLREMEQIELPHDVTLDEYFESTNDWFAYNRVILRQTPRDDFDATTQYSLEEVVKIFNHRWAGWVQTADYRNGIWEISVWFYADIDRDDERACQFIGALVAYQVSCEIISETVPNEHAWSDARYECWYKFSGQLIDIHQVFEWMNSRFAYM
jgi:hypothetical protein